MGLATVGRSRGAGAAVGHRLGAGLGQGIGVTEAGQGVSLQGMAQGTVSPRCEGPRVTIKRQRWLRAHLAGDERKRGRFS